MIFSWNKLLASPMTRVNTNKIYYNGTIDKQFDLTTVLQNKSRSYIPK